MNLYIGDTHFGHSAAIRFDTRPFKNVNEMDRYLITMWNDKVKDEDEVFDYMKKREVALNAGCMINHYTPVSLEELIKNNRTFQRG